MTVRVIVGGVGYPDLCDYSIGIDVQERLSAWTAPSNVSVEDLSYNPIAVIQRLNDEPDERRFARMVIVSAVKRGNRVPGTVTCYRWDGILPSEEEIQDAVTDAVTGIIALENTLVIAQYFKALPAETIVVEVEPETHEFGAALSEPVRLAFDNVCALVKAFATDDEAVAQLPVQSLTFAVAPGMRVL
ncbi:MAG: hypothetical protein M3Z30_07835 [Gemmatimonadota bacterium]|nr:hypothetical protein [Gemmatimonadota bacterium]